MAQKASLSQPDIQPIVEHPTAQQIVTVVGGSGFLGFYVVRALARRGYRVRLAVRRPNLAMQMMPLGGVGQVVAVQTNVRDRDSLEKAVRGSHAVINLVGILREKGKQTFQALHADGARLLAEVTPPTARLIHVSALGASENSESAYARSKAAGEAAMQAARKDVIIFRPSVLFGTADGFFNRLGAISRLLPVMPVLMPKTRVQPVFAGDVAEAIAYAVDGKVEAGRIYELGGPAVVTMKDVSEDVLTIVERKKKLFPLSARLASFSAFWIELIDKLSLGLVFPPELVFTRDQIALLKTDNVVSEEAGAEERTLKGIGLEPTAYDGVIPAYLERFRRAGEFEAMRERRNIARKS
jgi:Predicted nucleoside-diphosphate-sugar epimerases